MAEASGPRIGLWGTFDLENYGDMLFPWITRAELEHRLPKASVRIFAPVGAGLPNRFVTGEAVEPLGPWSPGRLARLADELDLVVIGGGEIIHVGDHELAPHYGLDPEEAARRAPSRYFLEGLGPDLERECPVVWHAVGVPYHLEGHRADALAQILARRPYVSVRDEPSRARLRAIGVDREVAVVPDPAFLLPRYLPADRLAARRERLAAAGDLPDGRYLAVQASAAGIPMAAAMAEGLRPVLDDLDAAPVFVEAGPCHGDDRFAVALARALDRPLSRVAGGLADVAAAIEGAEGFVGVSLHGVVTAFAYGRPRVVLGWGGETKLQALADVIESPACWVEDPEEIPAAFEKSLALGAQEALRERLVARVDAHFDRIAGVAEGLERRDVSRDRLRAAHEVRGRQLVSLRWRAADAVAQARAEARRQADEAARLRAALDAVLAERDLLRRDLQGKEEELDRLLRTRTFRYTAALRRVYGAVRRLGRRS